MLIAHAHYARSSAPAYPALHFKPFRFSNLSAASSRQRASPVVSRSISSDCRAVPSSVGTSGGSIGGAGSLALHLLAELALYCFAGRKWVDLALILR